MRRIRIKLYGDCEPSDAVGHFEREAERVNLPAMDRDRVRETIRSLAEHGRELAALGSHFRAKRTLSCAGCEVSIRANYGPQRRGLGSRIRALFAALLGR